jgi:hypothetical protein
MGKKRQEASKVGGKETPKISFLRHTEFAKLRQLVGSSIITKDTIIIEVINYEYEKVNQIKSAPYGTLFFLTG